MSTWLSKKKLRQYFEDQLSSSFLSLGSCSLHHVHIVLRKGLEALPFDIDSFFNDIHFFSFKLSSARWEDYACLESVTNVSAAYAMKHTETRCLSMNYIYVHVLEQWKI